MVNIPAFEHVGRIWDFEVTGPNENNHSQVTLPTVRKLCDGVGEEACCFDPPCCANPPCADTPGIVINHSDQVYTSHLDTWGGAGDASIAPSWKLFNSFEEAEYSLGFPNAEPYVGTTCPQTCNPQCDCVGSTCNTCVDQVAFNFGRQRAKMSRLYLSGKWMFSRYWDVTHGTTDVDDNLRGMDLTPPFEFLEPFMSAIDRAEFITALDDKLESIGASLGASPANRWDAGAIYVRTDYLGSRAPEHNYQITNMIPVADAGSGYPTFPAGSVIELVGSGTDSDAAPNPALTYLWTSDDSTIVLINPNQEVAQFTSPGAAGSFTFKLTVYDGSDMDTDSVTITTSDTIFGLVESVGCRYLAISPGGTDFVAIKVTSTALPCVTQYAQADGALGGIPVFQAPSQWNTVNVRGADIIPSTNYLVELEKIDSTLLTVGNATTWLWGDGNNDGIVNGTDILAASNAFQLDYSGATFEGTDIAPCATNGLVNAEDITWVVDAFNGTSFLSVCGTTCP